MQTTPVPSSVSQWWHPRKTSDASAASLSPLSQCTTATSSLSSPPPLDREPSIYDVVFDVCYRWNGSLAIALSTLYSQLCMRYPKYVSDLKDSSALSAILKTRYIRKLPLSTPFTTQQDVLISISIQRDDICRYGSKCSNNDCSALHLITQSHFCGFWEMSDNGFCGNQNCPHIHTGKYRMIDCLLGVFFLVYGSRLEKWNPEQNPIQPTVELNYFVRRFVERFPKDAKGLSIAIINNYGTFEGTKFIDVIKTVSGGFMVRLCVKSMEELGKHVCLDNLLSHRQSVCKCCRWNPTFFCPKLHPPFESLCPDLLTCHTEYCYFFHFDINKLTRGATQQQFDVFHKPLKEIYDVLSYHSSQKDTDDVSITDRLRLPPIMDSTPRQASCGAASDEKAEPSPETPQTPVPSSFYFERGVRGSLGSDAEKKDSSGNDNETSGNDTSVSARVSGDSKDAQKSKFGNPVIIDEYESIPDYYSFLFRQWYTRNLNINTQRYLNLFADAEIDDIRMLFEMDSDQMLTELGITNKVHRALIVKSIRSTRAKNESFRKWLSEKASFPKQYLPTFELNAIFDIEQLLIWYQPKTQSSASKFSIKKIESKEEFCKRLCSLGIIQRDCATHLWEKVCETVSLSKE